jgi:hypothetical protein
MKLKRIKNKKYTLITSGLFIIPILTYFLMSVNNVELYSNVPENKKLIPLPELEFIDSDNIWVISSLIGFFVWGILNYKLIENDENK